MSMSSDDFQVQNVYRFSRKSYKKSRRGCPEESPSPREEIETTGILPSARNVGRSAGFVANGRAGSPSCSREPDPDGDITNILHMKCPVISLAQQQLQRLLNETDKLICDNTRCCRSIYDFLSICKEVVLSRNQCQCVVLILLIAAFCIGLLFGAASCGTYLGRFNSPILSCIDSFFIPSTYPTIEQTFRSIV